MYEDENEDDATWDAPQPTGADFQLLERIGNRRAAIEALVPADRQDEAVRRHLLGILDRMEDSLCVHGHAEAAAEIEAGWTELAGYDAFLDREPGARRAAPGAAPGTVETEPGRELRGRALRLTAEPPQEEPGREERARWRPYVVELARRLDELQRLRGAMPAAGLAARPEGRVFLDAFQVFLPLADPRWWREHPPRKLNARVRRRLRDLRKERRRHARRTRDGEEDFRLRLYDAIDLYTRAGDRRGVDRCLRLAEAFAAVDAVPSAAA